MKDLTNQRFGTVTVLSLSPNRMKCRNGRSVHLWRCQCDCGRIVDKPTTNLKRDQSCGCLRASLVAQSNTTHGASKTRTFQIWQSMKSRCVSATSSNFVNYGNRGITICERWKSFDNFLADMGEAPDGLTLERKNVNEGYSPENCRWATRAEQNRNRRNTLFLTFQNKTQPLTVWAKELNISTATLRGRLRANWTTERALTERP